MKTEILKIIAILIFVSTATFDAYALESVQVRLVYPQKANAPKRELPRKEEPAIVSGEVEVEVAGIKQENSDSQAMVLEYFVDDEPIFSAKDDGTSGPKEDQTKFILNSALYPNGNHRIVVNLTDGDGSAIGMRDIIIKNEVKDAE